MITPIESKDLAKTAIVIPAYNEAQTIACVVREVGNYGTPIVVDDCSSDSTGDIAEEAGAVVVRHVQNQGYDGAIQSGFEAADKLGAGIIVTFDGDGQHSPEILEFFLKPIRDRKVQIVIGVRPSAGNT